MSLLNNLKYNMHSGISDAVDRIWFGPYQSLEVVAETMLHVGIPLSTLRDHHVPVLWGKDENSYLQNFRGFDITINGPRPRVKGYFFQQEMAARVGEDHEKHGIFLPGPRRVYRFDYDYQLSTSVKPRVSLETATSK